MIENLYNNIIDSCTYEIYSWYVQARIYIKYGIHDSYPLYVYFTYH